MSSADDVGLGLIKKYETLQSELSGLVSYINDTRRTLGGLHQELPAASDALAEVTRATETAAHNMIDLVEQIMAQDEAGGDALSKVENACQTAGDDAAVEAVAQLTKVSEERTELLIRMMTELSFQDLTCQTINKISSTILEIERRVIRLIDHNFGDGPAKAEIDPVALAGVSRLRENQSGTSRQDMVDALLKGE